MSRRHAGANFLRKGAAVIRVWAPRAQRVDIHLRNGPQAMMPAGRGWWSSNHELAHGDDYGFILDNAGPYPDPRSPHQPSGVHGLSRWVDHSLFRWTDADWTPCSLSSAVFYELHVGTFSANGTFDGVVERLDHLVSLGVTHVELMPVCEFPGPRGWGYDGVDLYAPHHAYGGPHGLKRLVDACHARGLAIVLDVVYNHLGPDGNYLGHFGPYFTDRYRTPWGDAINLDGPDSDDVRRFLIDNALMWLRDYHVDGLRLDAVHALIDTSSTHFLEALANEVDQLEGALGRNFLLIAESDLNDPRIVDTPVTRGYGIDAQWSDDFHHALHTALTGERSGYYADFAGLPDLATAIRDVFVYAGRYSVVRRRSHGRAVTQGAGSRFVVSTQNHDQIGNRAGGERLSHLVPSGKLKIAAALLLTAPFVPMLFQGEEWGASTPFLYFTSHEDAELAKSIREGRTAEFASFGWDGIQIADPQSFSSFDRSRLQWTELAAEPHASLLSWYHALIRLRAHTGRLRDGRHDQCQVSIDDAASAITVIRGDLAVVCNLGEKPATVPIPDGARVLLSSEADVEHGRGSVTLPPHSVVISSLASGDDPRQ